MRILLVEDDEKIAAFIAKGLKEAGYTVDHAANGTDGLHLALTETYDAGIFDIMLPEIDGLQIIETMRGSDINMPLIILSARHRVDDRIKGLQTGADDYLVKPFSFSELLTRVQALIRRSRGTTDPTSLSMADLTLNLLTREIVRAGRDIELQPREFALLQFLMQNAGKAISKTAILEHIWGYNFDPQTNTVDVLVCRLRAKIDKEFPEKLLHTLRGVGYVLKAP
ncbi:response regulator [Desulfoluna sp.]|uniref:response regulator n=1 Tax=Desulfoluna sp. TaxID=2045199 RepID=UPI00262715FB|nr:response regulator [Desulfoluna sp.]